MTATAAPAVPSAFDSSRWARWAAYLLIGWGVVVSGFGLWYVVQGVLYDDQYNMQYGILGIGIGAFILTAGVLHVVAGVFVIRHRTWARVLGIVIGLLGSALALTILPTAFYRVYTTVDDQVVLGGLNLTAVSIGLSIVPNVLIILGLVFGGRQFRRLS